MFGGIALSLWSLPNIMKSKSWMIVPVTCAAVLMQFCIEVESSYEGDKIPTLPGQPQVNFQQYAGYVTIDEKQQKALFYYFVEAESDPASKPLVLWLSGGPGCSSLGAGAFSEHGPFRSSNGESLVRNIYSWNKEANMLYLESPAGVGFSYSADTSFYNLVDDNMTANDNLQFLKQWFVEFPEYKDKNLFITGDSYAGHYVPQLAALIVHSGVNFNLKGIGIGNPLLEFATDFNSAGEYQWTHGLISDAAYELMNTICNNSQIWRERIAGSFSTACITVMNQLSAEIPDEIDDNDVLADTCTQFGQSQLRARDDPLRQMFYFPSSVQQLNEALNQPKSGEEVDPCVLEKASVYLNRKEVQEALHAKPTNWTLCSIVVKYNMQNLLVPTIDVVGSLVHSGIRVLVYSGDQDSVLPFFATRTMVNGLAKKLGLNATVPHRAWFVDKQVGGWTQIYGNNILSFATIRGAAHLAPLSSPKRSLALFAAFVAGKPLAEAVSN